jgi:hypothetical protein
MSTSRYLKEEKTNFDVHQPALPVSVVYTGIAAFWTSDAACSDAMGVRVRRRISGLTCAGTTLGVDGSLYQGCADKPGTSLQSPRPTPTARREEGQRPADTIRHHDVNKKNSKYYNNYVGRK